MAKLTVTRDRHLIDEKDLRETLLIIGQRELYWQFYPSEVGAGNVSLDVLGNLLITSPTEKWDGTSTTRVEEIKAAIAYPQFSASLRPRRNRLWVSLQTDGGQPRNSIIT